MIVYEYKCILCAHKMEKEAKMEDRNVFNGTKCLDCGEGIYLRTISAPAISVPEGACGNAANGYSSTHGDAENFKAGRKVY